MIMLKIGFTWGLFICLLLSEQSIKAESLFNKQCYQLQAVLPK